MFPHKRKFNVDRYKSSHLVNSTQISRERCCLRTIYVKKNTLSISVQHEPNSMILLLTIFSSHYR